MAENFIENMDRGQSIIQQVDKQYFKQIHENREMDKEKNADEGGAKFFAPSFEKSWRRL